MIEGLWNEPLYENSQRFWDIRYGRKGEGISAKIDRCSFNKDTSYNDEYSYPYQNLQIFRQSKNYHDYPCNKSSPKWK
jgi:hypothetical protein